MLLGIRGNTPTALQGPSESRVTRARITVLFHEALDFWLGKNFPRCSAIAA